MKHSLPFLLLLGCLFSCSSFSKNLSLIENPWSKVTTPTSGVSESIGSPSAGCLMGGVSMKNTGDGYYQMRPKRLRTFGHPLLIQFLEKSFKEIHNQLKTDLLFADLSQPRGGPTLTGHASHQTGLDIDIWFAQSDDISAKVLQQIDLRSSVVAPEAVDGSEMKVNALFTEKKIKTLEYFAKQPETDRIFVSAGIKKFLCLHYGNETWIQKIRPWYAHREHFHLRLKCKIGDELCKNTEPLPPGNSCDSTLDWWWSDEAKGSPSDSKPSIPQMPVLPQKCEEILKL